MVLEPRYRYLITQKLPGVGWSARVAEWSNTEVANPMALGGSEVTLPG